jgi:hypothetical protein
MAKEWLEDVLKQVQPRDIEKVDLSKAQAEFARISSATENPKRPGEKGSENPAFLSTSIKFEKGRTASGLIVPRVSARGMYLMPAGKEGTMDCCKDKTAGCAASCLHDSGFQDLANQIARNTMLERNPVEGLALINDEIHSHVVQAENNPARKGGPLLPSVRLDATSELHLDDSDIGDVLYGGMKGERQEVHTEGQFKGFPRMIGSEYGKRFAKNPLGRIGVPASRQPNVTRVASWSEGLHVDRAREIILGGNDITGPNTGARKARKVEGERIADVPFKGGSLVLPVVNYDEHDITGIREQTGSFGELSVKHPGFAKRTEENAQKSKSFLINVPTTPVAEREAAIREGRAEPVFARPTPVSIRPSRSAAFRG